MNLPANVPTNTPMDGFDVPEKTGNMIRGKIVKFDHVNKVFVADKVINLDLDTEYAVVGVVSAWVKWGKDANGKPKAEHRITQPGTTHPDRDELPDNDKALWPLDEKTGQKRDPWRDSRYLYLICVSTGTEFTFVTDNFGGRRAIGDLKTAISNMRYARPGALPIVTLGSVPWKTGYGIQPRPHFEIVGWRGEQPVAVIAPPPGSFNDIDEDEIPF